MMGAVLSVSALVLYLLSSSLIIILNKQLMVNDGFKYPLALTGLAQLAGAFAGDTKMGKLGSFVNVFHFPVCCLIGLDLIACPCVSCEVQHAASMLKS